MQYYITDGGGCYGLLLDASKAFDMVKYVKLFELLDERGICPLVVRFLAVFYSYQTARV